jgi:transketolase
MRGVGASAPAGVLMKYFGITPENVANVAKSIVK